MDIRRTTIDIFQKNRSKKSEYFNEDYFLTYLIATPQQNHKIGHIHNSFDGNRRHNSFLDDIQLEFAICFSFKDKDKNYSLEKFISRIEELTNNKRATNSALNYRLNQKYGWHRLVIINLVFLIILFQGFKRNIILGVFLGTLVLGINLLSIFIYQKEKTYYQKLKRIVDLK